MRSAQECKGPAREQGQEGVEKNILPVQVQRAQRNSPMGKIFCGFFNIILMLEELFLKIDHIFFFLMFPNFIVLFLILTITIFNYC